MKYIILERDSTPPTPVMFPDWENHKTMAAKSIGKVVSAGRCRMEKGHIVCFDQSLGLGLCPREEDAGIIECYLFA